MSVTACRKSSWGFAPNPTQGTFLKKSPLRILKKLSKTDIFVVFCSVGEAETTFIDRPERW